MRKRFGLRWSVAGLTVFALAAALMVFMVAGASGGVAHAAFTTIDASVDNPTNDPNVTLCKNGNPSVNCNIYTNKSYVWLSGGPLAANLDPGDYFWAVLVPGGQGGNQDPNDDTDKNLSDATLSPEAVGYQNSDTSFAPSGDSYTNRTFTINGDGTITYNGTHTFDSTNQKIRLMPYDDTTNNGGVYILAICSLTNATLTGNLPGVDPSDCKYDAFKVQAGNPTPCTVNCTSIASDLTASKTAVPAFNRAFKWNVAKQVDQTSITQYNGSPTATFNYTVTVNVLSHTDSWTVTGAITVTNPNTSGDPANPDDVTGVDVTDAIDNEPHATCTVTKGSASGNAPFTVDPSNATIPDNGSIIFPYSCMYTQAPANTSQTNTASVSWSTQFLGDGSTLVGNSVDTPPVGIDWSTVGTTLTDDCIDVTDTLYGGTLSSGVCTDASSHLLGKGTLGAGVTGTLNPSSGPPYTSLDLKYSNTVASPPLGQCSETDNTATFTTDDTKTTGTDGKEVEVCNYKLASDLTASKTAAGAFNRAFKWNIAKQVDKTSITQYNGSPTATFHYTVTVNVLSHTDSGWKVTGAITVTNPNTSGDPTKPDDVTGVDVTDAIDNEQHAPCTVTKGSASGNAPFTVDPSNATIPDNGSIIFPYSCTYTQAPANTSQTNTASVSWSKQTLGDGSVLLANSASTTPVGIDWTKVAPSLTDDCINVTDTLYGGTLSSGVCADASSHLLGKGTLGAGVTGTLNPSSGPPYTSLDLKYAKTIASPPLGQCSTTNNTATFTTDDTKATGSAGKSVQVCNYLALTIGYWGNHLADSTAPTKTSPHPWYDSYCASKTLFSGTGCSTQGVWTKQYLPQSIGPVSVTTVSTAAQIISLNNCSNATTSGTGQNAIACLAAQLLAAELNVGTGLANPCIVTAKDGINDANAFLNGGKVDGVTGVVYPGPGVAINFGSSANQTAVRNEALVLKNELVNYNQGGGC